MCRVILSHYRMIKLNGFSVRGVELLLKQAARADVWIVSLFQQRPALSRSVITPNKIFHNM